MEVEKWDWKDWRNWVAIAVWVLLPLFIFIGLVPGWSDSWDWFLNRSGNIASWFQAVGSIAAIVAGGVGLRWQVREGQRLQNEKDRENQRQSTRSKYLILFNRMSDVSSWAKTVLQKRSGWVVAWDLLREDCASRLNILESIKAAEYPSAIEILEIEYLINDMKGLFVSFDENIKSKEHQDVVHYVFSHGVNNVSNYSMQLMKAFKARAFEISTDNEKDEFQARLVDAVKRADARASANPSDTGKPQTQQPPAASQ